MVGLIIFFVVFALLVAIAIWTSHVPPNPWRGGVWFFNGPMQDPEWVNRRIRFRRRQAREARRRRKR